MRFFFNLVGPTEELVDEHGAEADDLGAALRECAQAIQDLGREDAALAREWRDWRLHVIDGVGAIVAIVGLDEAQLASLDTVRDGSIVRAGSG